MKKILFVMPTLRDGGAERSLVNLLTELPEDKYEIDLLLLKKQGTFLSQVPAYVNILEQPPVLKKLYGPVRKAGIYMPVKVFGNLLARIVKSGMGNQKAFMWEYFYKPVIDGLDKEYDVAVGYLGGESTYYIVDKVNAKRKIHWVHNDYKTSGMPKKYDLKLFPKVDAVVTISEECLEILKEEFPQFQDKFYCIENITSSAVIKARAKEFIPEEYKGLKNIGVCAENAAECLTFKLGRHHHVLVLFCFEWQEHLQVLGLLGNIRKFKCILAGLRFGTKTFKTKLLHKYWHELCMNIHW